MKMKRISLTTALLAAVVLTHPAWGQSASQTESTDPELRALEERIQRLESAEGRSGDDNHWTRRLSVYGVIEVEANYTQIDAGDADADDEDSSDIDLATVELGVDAAIVDHLSGHMLFKYEDDDLFVDEGFITISGSEDYPFYLIAGRQYLPFGRFDTHFITDPETLVLGETNDGALVAGYTFGKEWVDLSIGAFNGEVDERDHDDTVDSFVAAVTANPLEGLAVGASYTSNLAASDAFSEMVDGPVDDLIGGWSVFATFTFMERFELIGEYVAALDHFAAGEVYADAGDNTERKPTAWNVEFGAMLMDDLEAAVRYGGSDDGGSDFLPESQYGVVVNWGVFDNTLLALEYLHDAFADDGPTRDTLTAQLAIEF